MLHHIMLSKQQLYVCSIVRVYIYIYIYICVGYGAGCAAPLGGTPPPPLGFPPNLPRGAVTITVMGTTQTHPTPTNSIEINLIE